MLRQYAGILLGAGRRLKRFGILGDLIFTPLTAVWMTWPMAVAYLLEEPYYYLPASILTLVLIIKGYKTAQQAWSKP